MYIVESSYFAENMSLEAIKNYLCSRINETRLTELTKDLNVPPMLKWELSKRTVIHENQVKVISIYHSKNDHEQFEKLLMTDYEFMKSFHKYGFVLDKKTITYEAPDNDYNLILEKYNLQ